MIQFLLMLETAAAPAGLSIWPGTFSQNLHKNLLIQQTLILYLRLTKMRCIF